MKGHHRLAQALITTILLHSAFGQSTPTLCNSDNQGSCACGSGNVKTYVFTPGVNQRCIHTYIPDGDGPFPVLISVSAYGQGDFNQFADIVQNADYYGYAVIGLGSTGPKDGAGGFGLEFPSDGIVNPSDPTPCSSASSRDYSYIEGTLNFINDGLGDKLDSSKVYVEGFSQNSMYSAYISVCFADRIVGLWQGGSGLAKTFHTPITPGLQGQCSLSDFLEHGTSCCDANFCDDCKWWPIYPRTCEHKLIDCIAAYTNDNIACGSDLYMYEAMVSEGNDARMLSFSPASGINGGHTNPQNQYDWMVGCLGIVDSCSSACESSFLSCTSGGPDEFVRCKDNLQDGLLANCIVGCAPTLEMLKTSETPVVSLSEGKFGTQTNLPISQEAERPNCSKDFGSFDDTTDGRCRPPNGSGPADGTIESCSSTAAPNPVPTVTTSSPISAPAPAPEPITSPPVRSETSSPARTPTTGSDCINPGSNCFERRTGPGCDNQDCMISVCAELPECCQSDSNGWTYHCRWKAKQVCGALACECSDDDPEAEFFLRRDYNDANIPVVKSCNWLATEVSSEMRVLICRRFWHFGEMLSARFVCPSTCGLPACNWQ